MERRDTGHRTGRFSARRLLTFTALLMVFTVVAVAAARQITSDGLEFLAFWPALLLAWIVADWVEKSRTSPPSP